MALKKPSDYFKKESLSVDNSIQEMETTPELNTFSDAFESFKNNLSKIEVLSKFSETLDDYQMNIERVNFLSEKVEGIGTEIQNLLKKEDLDRAMMSQLLVVEQSILDVQTKVKGINEKNLTEIRLDVAGLTDYVSEFLENDVPKYKKLVVDSELRTSKRYEELEENVSETLDEIQELVEDKYKKLQQNLQGINEQKLLEIIDNFKVLDQTILELKEQEIPKYKNLIVETERKTESKLIEFDEKLNQTLTDVVQKINLVEGDKTDLVKIVNNKIQEIQNIKDNVVKDLKFGEDYKNEIDKKVIDLEIEIIRNESHIKVQNQNLEQIQENVRSVIDKLNLKEIEEQNYELGKKVKYLEKVFEKFNEKEFLSETIIVEPPSTNNKDSLTPLDQNFVTLDQLQQHYRLFINRIQQQLATIGGGGETQLKYLDDIVGIATNASAYDGKFLKYDHSLGKFEFTDVDVSNDSWVDGTFGPYTLGSVGIGTTNPTTRVSVAGSFTATDIRIQSLAEESTLINGNTVNLVYNTGSGNIAICTNPTGPITLNVTGIPTDSSFNNKVLTFTVVAIQTSIGYACNVINLNGVSRPIRYPGAIVSVASTSSYDIFNFTGINTIGSASTTANYQILGVVNGNFK